jgi:hypothetical protein
MSFLSFAAVVSSGNLSNPVVRLLFTRRLFRPLFGGFGLFLLPKAIPTAELEAEAEADV